MLFVVALALQAQIAVPPARPPATSRDSAARIQLLARARREETIFFYQWRWEWEKARDLIATDTRLLSLHCHGDGSMGAADALHLIATPFSRKAMCPIWFQGYGVTPQDEAIAIDNGLRPDARQRIRAEARDPPCPARFGGERRSRRSVADRAACSPQRRSARGRTSPETRDRPVQVGRLVLRAARGLRAREQR